VELIAIVASASRVVTEFTHARAQDSETYQATGSLVLLLARDKKDGKMEGSVQQELVVPLE
jgi:hypothetical protein